MGWASPNRRLANERGDVMFRVDVDRLASATTGILQETQDIRMAYERTDAALGAVLPTAGGAWYKTGSLATSQFKRDLGALKNALEDLSNTFSSANAAATGTLLAQYRSVLDAAEAGAGHGRTVYFDESVSIDSGYSFAQSSTQNLEEKVSTAKQALEGLEGAGSIERSLTLLGGCMCATRGRMDQTYFAFVTYRSSVEAFESEYASKLDSRAFMRKSLAVAINDGVKDAKGVFGILKHSFSLGGTLGKIAENTWVPSTTKPFAEGFSSKVGDWARPQKWRSSWDVVVGTGSRLSGVADDVGSIADDMGSIAAGADKVDDVVVDAAEAAKGAGNWGERASALGKLVGYVGDGLAVFGIATGAVKSYTEKDGDDADKAAAATYEVANGTAKFLSGKAVGAGVGTAIGGPVGTAVGFVAGCVVDIIWDRASDWLEDSGAKDAIVDGLGSAYRAAGTFISDGFRGMAAP